MSADHGDGEGDGWCERGIGAVGGFTPASYGQGTRGQGDIDASRCAHAVCVRPPAGHLSRMASFDELPFKYRISIKAYRWRTVDGMPWAELTVPLGSARIALVTSAGLYRKGMDRDFGTKEGEDITVRLLPSDVPLDSLAVGQTSDAFDRSAIEADRNLALPLDRLRELCEEGIVREVAPRVVSFNGSMLGPGRFLRDTAPGVVDALKADRVDAALFVPV